MKLLVATANKGKMQEFKRILEPLGAELLFPAEVGATIEVEETGETFKENAYLKAKELFDKTGIPTIADDSGLCIDAMDGRPGVKTARYGGIDLDYPGKFELIYAELAGIPDEKRTAAFVCNICCIVDSGHVIETEGRCEGLIGNEPRGTNGFGYDPILYIDARSLGEFSDEEKDSVSHRGKALRLFAGELEKIINGNKEK